jgi:Protein of unknown function (DUF3892)
MATYYIVCVDKHPYHADPHSRIQRLGTNESRGSSSVTKMWTTNQVIAAIHSGDRFYSTDRFGDRVRVVVATHLGHDYIKTKNDGVQPDNLLAKADC